MIKNFFDQSLFRNAALFHDSYMTADFPDDRHLMRDNHDCNTKLLVDLL